MRTIRKKALRKCERQRQSALCAVHRTDVLQQCKRGTAGGAHQRKKTRRIPAAQRSRLLGHARIFAEEVHGPEQRQVGYALPQRGQRGIKRIRIDLGQHTAAKPPGNEVHILRDRRIFVREVGVAPAGVDKADGKTKIGKVDGDPLHPRRGLVKKVDGHKPSHRGGKLVHQPARFAEKRVLRLSGHLRKLHRIARGTLIQPGHAVAEQHRIGCRGGQPRAARHVRAYHRVKPADHMAALLQPGRHAAQQCRRGIPLRRNGRQPVERQPEGRIALGFERDAPLPVRCGHRRAIHRHRRGEHASALVIGMVAADLCAARRGENRRRPVLPKTRRKAQKQRVVPVALRANGIRAIQGGQHRIERAAMQQRPPLRNGSAHHPSPLPPGTDGRRG